MGDVCARSGSDGENMIQTKILLFDLDFLPKNVLEDHFKYFAQRHSVAEARVSGRAKGRENKLDERRLVGHTA